MSATYAAASSYEDPGTVTTVYSGNSPHTDKLSFETAFVRGKRFRFEYRHDHEFKGWVLGAQRYTIWSDFAHTYSEWTVRPGIVDDGPDLGLSLGAAAGVSSISSVAIPEMLMPNVVGRSGVLRVHAPAVDGTETVDGHPCWRVYGDNRGDSAGRTQTAAAIALGRDRVTKIRTVMPSEPGDRAGLLAGDEIVAVEGRPVVDASGSGRRGVPQSDW
jgi:hypothetical protein